MIQDICDEIERELDAVADAHSVLNEDDASPQARSLAMRTLDRATKGYPQLLDEIRKRSERMNEEIQHLHDTDAA
jgi:hypothetical protein